MSYSKLGILVVCAWLLFLLAVAKDTPRVSFIRPPSFVSDQDTITLQVRVPPQAENRVLFVAAYDGDVLVNGSQREMNGAHAPALYNLHWRLPAGAISLVAAIYGAHEDELARVTHEMTVLSSGP